MVRRTTLDDSDVIELTSKDRLIATVALQATYGLTASSADDPVIRSMNKIVDEFSQISTPGAYLVDSFPIREWFGCADSYLLVLTAARSQAHTRMVPWSVVQDKGTRATRKHISS